MKVFNIYTNEDVDFKFLIFSLILHLSIFLFIILASNFTFFNPHVNNPLAIKIHQASIRVDVVAMPKMTLLEKQALAEANEPEQQAAQKVSESPESKAAEQPEFLEKGKRESFLNKLKKFGQNQNTKKEASEEQLPNSELQKLVVEGNRVSKGTSITGDYSNSDLTEFENYGQSVVEKVREYWKLPSYLLDKNLSNQIQIFISAQGELLKINVFKSSGMEAYDLKAIESIKNAAPFGPPPSAYIEQIVKRGMVLAFPL